MKEKIFIYLYGIYYDANLPRSIKNSDNIMVYTSVRDIDRKISSLEGIFISLESLTPIGNPLCKRIEMENFEKKYSGKFHKFS